MLNSICLISIIYQHELGISVHMPLPPRTSLPPFPIHLGCYRAPVMESRKMVLMILFTGSSGDADTENRLMDKSRGEEGEAEMNAESSMEAYILVYVI